jgi:hypothetical protein
MNEKGCGKKRSLPSLADILSFALKDLEKRENLSFIIIPSA